MKRSSFKISLIAMAITTSVFIFSCGRNNKTVTDNDTNIAKDNALSEFAYNDALNISDEASTLKTGDNLGSYKTASNCATITHDTISSPHVITVNFGTTNCLCNDGRYRRGKIKVTYLGHYRDSGSVHTITFIDYFVNDNHIMGSKSVTNMGHNAAGQTYFNITVNGKIIKATTGDSIIWNQNRVRTWIAGESTLVSSDDVYQITGSGNGQRANGTTYTITITTPLVKAIACSWIESGEVQIQPTGGNMRTINYGNGTCDNQATMTVNGVTTNITLN